MKLYRHMALIIMVPVTMNLMGCVTLSGNATLSEDGTTAVLQGQPPMEVRELQPALPPPPPPVPQKAKIVEERIEISEKVQFALNAADILPASNDLLNDVAAVMTQHPEVKKIRIEGHASSEGNAKHNKELSDRRAASVKEFLVNAGVAAERMETVGYGIERPIADNDTEAGREANRRVEFNIIERLSAAELAALNTNAANESSTGAPQAASEETEAGE